MLQKTSGLCALKNILSKTVSFLRWPTWQTDDLCVLSWLAGYWHSSSFLYNIVLIFEKPNADTIDTQNNWQTVNKMCGDLSTSVLTNSTKYTRVYTCWCLADNPHSLQPKVETYCLHVAKFKSLQSWPGRYWDWMMEMEMHYCKSFVKSSHIHWNTLTYYIHLLPT